MIDGSNIGTGPPRPEPGQIRSTSGPGRPRPRRVRPTPLPALPKPDIPSHPSSPLPRPRPSQALPSAVTDHPRRGLILLFSACRSRSRPRPRGWTRTVGPSVYRARSRARRAWRCTPPPVARRTGGHPCTALSRDCSTRRPFDGSDIFFTGEWEYVPDRCSRGARPNGRGPWTSS